MNIINDPWETLGGGYSQLVGQGLGQGLAQLAHHKIGQKLEQRQQSKLIDALSKTGNFTPESARAAVLMAGTHPASLPHVLQMFGHNPEEMQIQQMGNNEVATQPYQQQSSQMQQQPMKMEQKTRQQQPIIDQTGITNLQKLFQQQQDPLQQLQNPMINQVMQQSGRARGQSGQPGNIPPFNQGQLAKILGQPTPQEEAQPMMPNRMPIPQVATQNYGTNAPKRFGFGGFWGTPAQQLAQEKFAHQLEREQIEDTRRQEEELGKRNDKQQEIISRKNEPFKKELDKMFLRDYNMVDLAQEAKQLIATEQTRSGLASYLPLVFGSPETQELDKIYNQLALAISTEARGPLTGPKIAVGKAVKPNMQQTIETQNYLLDKIIEKGNREGIGLQNIVSKLKEENDGREPANLGDKAMDEWRNIYMPGGKVPDQQRKNAVSQVNRQGNKEQSFPMAHELGEIAKNIGGPILGNTGAAMAGGLTGLTNLVDFGLGGINYGLGKAGYESPILNKIRSYIPTSEKLINKMDEATGGLTKPKGPIGEAIRKMAEVFGSIATIPQAAGVKYIAKGINLLGASPKVSSMATKMIMPFSGLAVPTSKALKYALYGQAGAETAKAFGAGPLVQAVSRVAFAHTFANPNTRTGLKELANNNYNGVKKEIRASTFEASEIEHNIKQLEKVSIREGTTHKKELDEITKSVKDSLENPMLFGANGSPRLAINDAISLKQNLNKRYGWSERPSIVLGEGAELKSSKDYLPEAMRKPLGNIIRNVNASIEDALKDKPNAAKLYAEAEDIYKGLGASGTWTKWLADAQKMRSSNAHGWKHNLYTGAKSITFGSAKRGTQMVDLFTKYPPAKKYWLNAWKEAERGNRAGWVLNVTRLGSAINQYEEKSKD